MARGPLSSRMTSQAQQTDAPFFPLVHWPIIPRNPAPFHGDAFEDVDDWIDQYERVARHNGWTLDHCRQSFYFSLENTARIWYENNERPLTSSEVCKERLRRPFGNQYRRQKAEDLLQRRIQGPNESVISFAEDVLRLITRIYPQATEENKLRSLMRGVRSDIFCGLVRNPPTTVEGFVTEATNVERALTARNDHYHRMTDAPTISAFASAHFLNHASEGYIRGSSSGTLFEKSSKAAAVFEVASFYFSRSGCPGGGATSSCSWWPSRCNPLAPGRNLRCRYQPTAAAYCWAGHEHAATREFCPNRLPAT
ncbi:hypothetical protein HPB48_021523 [Haemaphysalis longicornis]|uniref:Tick transposon n=1 Tax=Haemaphysalis longicornis TaxID=44386 RepID=A0A9J6FMS9_HAELO|nr:hypothetical protein HPB48_021523 [Haemaphysalis longicornis]